VHDGEVVEIQNTQTAWDGEKAIVRAAFTNGMVLIRFITISQTEAFFAEEELAVTFALQKKNSAERVEKTNNGRSQRTLQPLRIRVQMRLRIR
jgi:hypothetical protein